MKLKQNKIKHNRFEARKKLAQNTFTTTSRKSLKKIKPILARHQKLIDKKENEKKKITQNTYM